MHGTQELSQTTDANLVHSLMNIHESQLDEFKDELTFQKLTLTPDEVESWIMVHIHVYMYYVCYLPTHTQVRTYLCLGAHAQARSCVRV